jgi:predicted nuclease of restriction endonuclease-like (RecB) superfamily
LANASLISVGQVRRQHLQNPLRRKSGRHCLLNPDHCPPFPLPWSHYVRLLSVADPKAREYYEHEALRDGWSVRQLDRQIATLAYQRSGKARSIPAKDDALPADAHVRDPFVLEFLNLKDEYSETELEDALIHSLEQFLLQLGSDFAFIARQKRLRVGNERYRVDLSSTGGSYASFSST